MKRKLILLLAWICFHALCFISNAPAITRSEVIANGVPYTTMMWYCETANYYNATYDYTSKFPIGGSYMGEAYCWGGWDSWGAFYNRLDAGATAGCATKIYGIASGWAAGTDCSGYVSLCWGLSNKHSTETLPDITLEIDDNQLKPGDILNNAGEHVGLFVNGTIVNVSIAHAVMGEPHKVIYQENQNWGDYTPYSIFPQFSTMIPAPDDTAEIENKPFEIKLTAEGSKSIENVLMWLDGNSVTPAIHGSKTRKTIKYKPESISLGKHEVKVKCSNVVNGITYEDEITWKFNYSGAGDTVKITDAIESYLGPKERPFYTTTVNYLCGNNYGVVLAGNSDGTSQWMVDDIIRINVTHIKDGTTDSWEYKSLAKLQEPVDLSYLFDWDAAGNSVYVELANDPARLNYVGCTALWLVGTVATKYISGKALVQDEAAFAADSVKQNTNIYRLVGCSPNPVRNQAVISYELPANGGVVLSIYNLNGQLVKTLVNAPRSAGIHKVSWDGTNNNGQKVGQGVYLYRIVAGNFTDTKKLILLK